MDHYRALSSAIKLVSGIVQHGKEEIGRTARIVHSLYFQSHELWVELNRLDIPLFASAFDASRSNRYYPAPTFDRTRAAA